MSDIVYQIGATDNTLVYPGSFTFNEAPNFCGYTQTISVVGLPDFVSYDSATNQFTIDQTLIDSSDVGSLTYTIESSIEVPDTWEKLTFTTFSVN